MQKSILGLPDKAEEPVLKVLALWLYLNFLRPLGADKQTVIKHQGKLMPPVTTATA